MSTWLHTIIVPSSCFTGLYPSAKYSSETSVLNVPPEIVIASFVASEAVFEEVLIPAKLPFL